MGGGGLSFRPFMTMHSVNSSNKSTLNKKNNDIRPPCCFYNVSFLHLFLGLHRENNCVGPLLSGPSSLSHIRKYKFYKSLDIRSVISSGGPSWGRGRVVVGGTFFFRGMTTIKFVVNDLQGISLSTLKFWGGVDPLLKYSSGTPTKKWNKNTEGEREC